MMTMSDPKPVSWNCPCGVRYRIGEETTIRGYHRQPWLSHLQIDCPHCHQVFIAFQPEDVILNALCTQVPDDKCEVEFADFAPDFVVDEYARQKDLPAITEHWLPKDDRSMRRVNHDESLILFFRFLLERGEEP
jgi:hypothetical protein